MSNTHSPGGNLDERQDDYEWFYLQQLEQQAEMELERKGQTNWEDPNDHQE